MMVKELKWYERSRPEGVVEKVWLSTATAEQLAEINVCDWLEGYGVVMSLAEQEFIRRYGFLLLKYRDGK
jgi:hypothetical protein